MSAPIVLGSEAAYVQAYLGRLLGTRGFRRPLEAAELHSWLHIVRGLKLSERDAARGSLALEALENYYRAIGARDDARRMSDARWAVDMVLSDYTREHEAQARHSHADMWVGAFKRAFWAVDHRKLPRGVRA